MKRKRSMGRHRQETRVTGRHVATSRTSRPAAPDGAGLRWRAALVAPALALTVVAGAIPAAADAPDQASLESLCAPLLADPAQTLDTLPAECLVFVVPTPTEPPAQAPAPTDPAPAADPQPAEPAPSTDAPGQEPTAPDPAPSDPPSAEPTEPAPTEPAPTDPAPADPEPTEPAPSDEPTEPAPGEGPSPAPTEPTTTPSPAPTAQPTPTTPAQPAEPAPSAEQAPSQPNPSQPNPSQPNPTQPNPAPVPGAPAPSAVTPRPAFAFPVPPPSATVLPSGWSNPVKGRLTSAFGMRVHPVLGGHAMHAGQDVAAACGRPVHAAAAGTVVWVGGAFQGRTGNQVVINHGEGVVTRYGHLLTGSLLVRAGEQVAAGQAIAAVGGDRRIDPLGAGNSTGCHLHFEVNLNNGLTPVDPASYLALRGISLGVDSPAAVVVVTPASAPAVTITPSAGLTLFSTLESVRARVEALLGGPRPLGVIRPAG